MKAMTAEEKKTVQKKNASKSGKMRVNEKVLNLTILGLLTAIMIIMTFTPLGYLKMPGLSITFMTIPVIVAAAILTPKDSAIIGGVFGLTSFIQAVTGMSALTVLLCNKLVCSAYEYSVFHERIVPAFLQFRYDTGNCGR